MVKRFGLLLILVMAAAWTTQAQVGGKPTGPEVPLDYTNPRKYQVGGITVSGAKYLDQNALISITGLKIGDPVTLPGEDLGKAINKLWDQGILGDIEVYITKIEGTQVFLEFFLTERPRMSRVQFSGIKKGQSDDLEDKIKLNRGKVVTDALINTTKNTVQKYFQDKGFMNVKVNIFQRPDSVLANSVVLNVNIDRGDKVKIEEINIIGNEAIPDAKLKKQMKETKEKKLYKFFTASKFQRATFEEDKQKVIDHYNSQGYRDAQIVSDSVYSLSEDRLGITLRIDEGQKYYFRNISWNGNYVYDEKQLATVLGIESGDVYSKELLDKRLQYDPKGGVDVSSLYMDDGYLFFRIDPVEVMVEGDSIDIEMRIYEGAQARIKDITIAGNTKTSDHVVLRELYTIPGQKFSRTNLINSQREIASLGYFDPETIGMNPIPNEAEGTVDIKYTVTEKPNDQITLSGGWGGSYGVVGTVGLVLNNFSARKATDFRNWRPIPSGDGQRLALNIQANGLRYQSYSLSFTEPWLGGRRRNSFSVGLNKTISRQIDFGSNQETGAIKINGGSVSLGRRLRWPDNNFSLSHSLSYNQYISSGGYLNYFNQAATIDDNATSYSSNSVSFITNFSRNSLDQITFPRRGSSIGLSLSLTPPYSMFNEKSDGNKWVEFHKWMFDASFFTPLSAGGKLVFNTRAHFGFVGSYGPGRQMSPFERFRLGGSGLGGGQFRIGSELVGLRGYEDESITPTEPNSTITLGGTAFNKYVAEMRYLVSPNPAATVFVLAFAEAGNNFNDYSKYNPFKLYRSVGVGARIFMSAFGLLGFDYGIPFDQLPGREKKGQFHFIIGQQLR
jgi:outer membrane protein insertion porin family